MDIFSNVWGYAVALAVLVVIVITWRNHVRKRERAQFKADESTIKHFVVDLGYEEKQTYRDLPNREARLTWLNRHFPAFKETIERHYKDDSLLTGAVAVHVDFKLLQNLFAYKTRERVLSSYQYESYDKSLNEYQEFVHVRNEEYERLEELSAAKEAQRVKEARERRVKQLEEEKVQKEAAKVYWDSLSPNEQQAFKKAKGKSDRQNALPSTAITGYSVDTIYPFIMATMFNDVSTNTNNSIDYCQSPHYSSHSDSGSNHSSSHDSGGYSSHDSGSSCSSDGGGE